MSESIVIQVIISLSSIIVALISLIAVYMNRQDVKDVKHQVKNAHSTNLRKDLDDAKLEAELAKNSALRTEVFVSDLNDTINSFAHSLKRHFKLTAKAAEETKSDVNEVKLAVNDVNQKLIFHIEKEMPDEIKKVLATTSKMIEHYEKET